ncbi:MAG: hypothetical protein IKA78_07225 [Oscillospiraceae bacterium]|nr:hypothetical protein [Oscillospiraceae bacterium]
MRRRLSGRQLCAFCLLAVLAPALCFLCGLAWYTALLGGALCALALMGFLVLWRSCGRPGLSEVILEVWGSRAGKILLAAQSALLILLLNGLASGVSAAFPDTQTQPFTPLVLLAVCAWACRRGRDAVVRACGVLFLFLAALLICVFFFALPDVHLRRLLQPVHLASPAALGVLLLPGCGLFLAEGQTEEQTPGGWLCALAILPAAAAAFCAAVPGSRGSFYQMAKSVEVLSVAQRIEPLVSVAFVIGWFGCICLLGLSVGAICGAMGRDPDRCAAAACLAAIPGAIAPVTFCTEAFLPASAVTILLPALTLLRRRKMRNEK